MGKIISAIVIALFAGFVGSFWVIDWMEDRERAAQSDEQAKTRQALQAYSKQAPKPEKKAYTEEDALGEIAWFEKKLTEMQKDKQPGYADAKKYAGILAKAPTEIAEIVLKMRTEKVETEARKLLKNMQKVQEAVFPRIRRAWVSATAYDMMDRDVTVKCRGNGCSGVQFSGYRYSLQSRIKSDYETFLPEFEKFRFRKAVFEAYGNGISWDLRDHLKDRDLAE